MGTGLDAKSGHERASLRQALRMRHMTMISLGGVIGAGLFVGSGAVIQTTGPAAVVSYALAGFLVILIMRMLGEMATARPAVGSFAEYGRIALGEWAGFLMGWLYWYFWVIVVAVEATAGALTLHNWLFPGVPLWVLSLILLLLLTLSNLLSVRSYGEFEYWFAFIKVAAIVVFIVLAGLFVLGLWPGSHLNFSNLTAYGGFAPKGVGALFADVTTLIFSFFGSEIVTIAAAESKEPAKAVARATNSVIWRVLVFYVLSIFLIVTMIPWNDSKALASPYVSALSLLHIPGVAAAMNVVVITAVLSCLNSGLYTASRMLFALAYQGNAPKALLRTNRRGVPARAILFCTIVGYLSIIMDYVSPQHVFLFLLNSSGAVGLFIYLLIACSELVMRRRMEREGDELKVRMWLFPFLTYLCIAAMTAVIVAMAFQPGDLSQLVLSLVSVAVLLVVYAVKRWYGRGRSSGDAIHS
ncbi:amino acid permease [Alicyclobacillus mali]|uniref:Amino acid permease n=1 Tax=Alicyclobacillus mali (ex Roth et al. 2021) TaxID=1123961 RepID=A0ABS0F3Z3_9BACL|nr:amino acid permease [Alicyclobacillus mali (ex Roth et al. 2021)]MBF8378040.1 amino acid permease [Alicyclobacillus mali (ex Roth et al. 2021)]